MKEFVSFEIAKKLKDKGFRLPCLHRYKPYSKTLHINEVEPKIVRKIDYSEFYNSFNSYVDSDIDAPTIPQVLKWLREEKKIHIETCILVDADADGKIINEYIYWSFSVTSIETGNMIYFEYEHINDRRFDSYEQAALAGIEHCLNNLI